jgi:4-hydroxybenzoate polyprenyltransferase
MPRRSDRPRSRLAPGCSPGRPDLNGSTTTAIVGLARASHFPPTVAVTAFTTALAIDAGRGAGSVLVAAAALSGQLTVGWSNDYLDRHRDAAANRHDKPIVSGAISAGTVRASAIAAFAACVPLSLLSGWRAGAVHLAAVGVAWSYNRRLKSTPFSVVPYALAFGSLPAFVSLGLRGHPWPPAWSVVAAGLLGAGAHFVNTLPDLADDAATGVVGLPHRVGATGSLLIGTGLLAAATAVVLVGPDSAVSSGASVLAAVDLAAVAGVAVAAASGRERSAWMLCLLAAATTVVLYIAR